LTRIKRGVTKHKRHKKVLSQTKTHRGNRHSHFRRAKESLMHALRYSYEHRKERKGDMRRLWNIRINAAAREHGITYSSLIHGMKIAGIQIDRKILSDLAIQNPEAFTEIVSVVKVTMESNQTAA